MDKYELARQLKAPAVDREAYICNTCTGKSVIDLGCIRHNAEFASTDPNWLHKRIKAVALRVVGVDYLRDEIPKLVALGFDIQYGDVTRPLDIMEQFDVIVAGDLIEHLVNFEGFFDNCKRLLKPGGVLLLSTPNPFFADEYHYVAFKGSHLINPEHTCWIDPLAMLQLVSRFDLQIDHIRFVDKSWRLSRLICNSPASEFDILNGRWSNNTLSRKVFRRLFGLAFGLMYTPLRWLTGSYASLVRHSDYLAVISKSDTAGN